jgi:hypothetical protein
VAGLHSRKKVAVLKVNGKTCYKKELLLGLYRKEEENRRNREKQISQDLFAGVE